MESDYDVNKVKLCFSKDVNLTSCSTVLFILIGRIQWTFIFVPSRVFLAEKSNDKMGVRSRGEHLLCP